MATLSNINIEQEILKGNILIFPFDDKQIRGASYNFKVSKFAWKLEDGKTDYETAYDEQNNLVRIPAKATGLILTHEIIWVSNKISGTYHSKVAIVCKGVGHIGTTLDPEYIGPSLIAIHNHSSKPIEFTPERETFVSLVFQYLDASSSIHHGNSPGRLDVFNDLGIRLSQYPEVQRYLDQDLVKNPTSLKLALHGSDEFKEFKRKLEKKKYWFLIPYAIIVPIFILLAISSGILHGNENNFKKHSWYKISTSVVDNSLIAFAAAFITQLASDIRHKYKEE
ncbi:MAG: hypothetical protein WBV73_07825 [Phormidium sp.]